jgi:hypothetical protein
VRSRYWIDQRGSRAIALKSTFLLWVGFTCITGRVTHGQPSSGELAGYYFLLGLGSAGTALSCITLNIKLFSSKNHGRAVGIPVAFYGLSAFFFVQIKQFYFDPLPSSDDGVLGFMHLIVCYLAFGFLITLVGLYEPGATASHAPGQRAGVQINVNDEEIHSFSSLDVAPFHVPPKVTIPVFLKSVTARYLILVFFIAAGTGLMVIGNVGAVVTALSPSTMAAHERIRIQGTQVSILSIGNALGRILGGVLSDAAARYGTPERPAWRWRAQCFYFSMLFLVLGQGLVSGAVHETQENWIQTLSVATALTGFAYGTIWSISPSVVSEWIPPGSFGSIWYVIRKEIVCMDCTLLNRIAGGAQVAMIGF